MVINIRAVTQRSLVQAPQWLLVVYWTHRQGILSTLSRSTQLNYILAYAGVFSTMETGGNTSSIGLYGSGKDLTLTIMVYKYHLSHPNDFTHKSILKIIILFDFWNKNIFRKNCSLRICMFKLLIRVPLNNIHELESATIIQTWINYRVKFWTLIYVIKKSLEMQIYCLKVHNKCLRHLVLINLRNHHLCIYRSCF